MLVAVCLLSALLTSLITLNGAVAALLPLVVLLAHRIGLVAVPAADARGLRRQRRRPADADEQPGQRHRLRGRRRRRRGTVPVLLVRAGRHPAAGRHRAPSACSSVLGCCPRRVPEHAPPDLGRHAETLEAQYQLTDGFYRLRVRSRSDLIGRGRPTGRWRRRRGPGRRRRVARRARRSSTPSTTTTSSSSPGPPHDVTRFAVDHGLAVSMIGVGDAQDLLTREAGVAEVVVPPRSRLVGESVYPGHEARRTTWSSWRSSGSARTCGDGADRARRGRRDPAPRALVGPRPAQPGPRRAAGRLPRPRPPPGRPVGCRRRRRPSLVLAALVVMLGLRTGAAGDRRPDRRPWRWCWPGWSPSPQAYRSVSWQTVVLVGALIPLSTAIQTSGAADRIASLLIDAVGHRAALPAAGGALRPDRGARPGRQQHRHRPGRGADRHRRRRGDRAPRCKPVLMVVAIAGCAALLTPIATPAT